MAVLFPGLITEQSSPKEYVKLLCTSHAVKVGYGLWFMSYSTFIKPFQTCLAVFLARKLLDRQIPDVCD